MVKLVCLHDEPPIALAVPYLLSLSFGDGWLFVSGTHYVIGETDHATVDNLEDVEPPLNEDDDIVDDFDQINGEPDTNHLVLAQFDKVNISHN